MTTNLVEICCKCGFVHRDDRHPKPDNKQKKLHYHWMPAKKEVVKNNYTMHATICVSCVEDNNTINWELYNLQRIITPEKYYISTSYNASLPEKYIDMFDHMYYDQTEHFNVEI
jgi:hypothetical protein